MTLTVRVGENYMVEDLPVSGSLVRGLVTVKSISQTCEQVFIHWMPTLSPVGSSRYQPAEFGCSPNQVYSTPGEQFKAAVELARPELFARKILQEVEL
jgi:hypothetical protein